MYRKWTKKAKSYNYRLYGPTLSRAGLKVRSPAQYDITSQLKIYLENQISGQPVLTT